MRSIRPIFAAFFALLVFLSSSSFTVGLHFCGGKMKDIAFLNHADGCDHNVLPACHKQVMEDCCNDAVVAYEGQGFDHTVVSIHIPDQPVSDAHLSLALLSLPFISTDVSWSNDDHYDPPLRSMDRSVIHQVFLI